MSEVSKSTPNSNSQPPLLEVVEWRHNYDNTVGGEFPFVQGHVITQETLVASEPGVSVPLTAGRAALVAISKRYGLYNMGEGMFKAVQDPQLRQEIEQRYADVDRVAEGAKRNGEYTYVEERAWYQPVLKEAELEAAGFLAADIDVVAKSVMYDVRRQLGVSVRAPERRKNLKKTQGE